MPKPEPKTAAILRDPGSESESEIEDQDRDGEVEKALRTLLQVGPEVEDAYFPFWAYVVRLLLSTWSVMRPESALPPLHQSICDRADYYMQLKREEWQKEARDEAREHTADTSDSATQTECKPTRSTATDAPSAPPARTYAAVAVQTPPTHRGHKQAAPPPGRKEGHRQQAAPPQKGKETKSGTPVRKEQKPPRGDKGAPSTTRALVMHAAPLKYKPGTMRRWIEEDNKRVKILGIRWLLREDRRGQVASSLVIYMRDLMEVTKLRMGRRLFRTTSYDWDR